MKTGSGWLITLWVGLSGGCARPEQQPSGAAADSTPAAAPSAPGPSTWQVRHDGVGPIRIGATISALQTAFGTRLPRADSLDPRCDYLRAPDLLPGVWFMMIEGQVARLDVDSAGPATVEGVRVGDDAAKVQQLYAPRVTITPHKYTDGQYLTVSPAAPADSAYRMIFETDGRKLTRYRVGRLPEVGWVESCS